MNLTTITNTITANAPLIFKENLDIKQYLNGVTPHWLQDIINIPKSILQEKEILNLSSYSELGSSTLLAGALIQGNTEGFLFKSNQWPIGGIYFDGIMRTEHNSTLRMTTFPVQNGTYGVDHAVVEPSLLVIEVMMSDVMTIKHNNSPTVLNQIQNLLQKAIPSSNAVQMNSNLTGEGHSVNAWSVLKSMQQSRIPITVETRLQTYNNMLIESLSAPDDFKTQNALRCTVRLKEIITVGTGAKITSARPELQESNNTQAEVNAKPIEESVVNGIVNATQTNDFVNQISQGVANGITWLTNFFKR